MNAASTLAELAQADIRLWLDDGQLRFSAPDGAMTPQRITKLRQQKTDIIEFLSQSANSQSEAITVTDKNQTLALSAAQQRLWFLNQLEPSNSAYNIHAALNIHGSLDSEKLKSACLTILHHHDILHSHYRLNEGKAVTGIDALDESLTHCIYQQKNIAKNDIAIELEQQLNHAFDLANGPILHIRLFTVDNEHHVLSFTIHHIASDGWSMGILVSEVIALYQASGQALQKSDQKPKLQYADYAAFQQQPAQQEKLEKSLGYWQRQLSHVPIVQLPLDYPRHSKNSHDGASIDFSISASQTQALQTLCQAQGATLFMGLMALYSGLIFRIGEGNNDFSIGSPVAGRSHSQVEQMMGCFVNILALRFEIDHSASFNDLINQSKVVSSEAFLHQDVPFERIVNALDIERDMAINPVFQTLLVLQNTPFHPSNIDGLSISPIAAAEQAAQFDLSINIHSIEQSLGVKLIYKKALFNRKTIERLAVQMQRLLSGVLPHPDKSISRINLLSGNEQQQLQTQLQQWNNTEAKIDLCDNIQAMIETQVLSTPNATAVEDTKGKLSYQHLNERANQLAHYLIAQSIGENDKVVLHLAADNHYLIALLAVIKTGAAYLPIDISYPDERCQFIIQHSQSKLVISNDAISHGALALNKRLSEHGFANFSSENPPLRNNPESLFYCIYTSGSTGTPKGVDLLEAGTTNLVKWYRKHYEFNAQDRFLMSSSIAFDLTQKNVFTSLCIGARLILPSTESFNSHAIYQLLNDKKISVINSAPTALSSILKHHASDAPQLCNLRWVLLGGETIKQSLITKIRSSSSARIHNMYGPTECTDIVTYHEITNNDDMLAIIGKPIPNVRTAILDTHLQHCAIGDVGQLYISGICLAKGYTNDTKSSANSFIDVQGERFFNTADLARYSNDGNIEYCGRSDHQVKVRGLRIELGEIEQQLLAIDGINDAIVTVQKDKLVAFYIAEQHSLDSQQLRLALMAKLPHYMLPSSFMVLLEWPLTPSGKIHRLALPPADFDHRETEYLAPESDTEKQLVDIWQRALNAEKVGITDNFFDLGGHSLIAAEMFSLTQEQFQVDIPLRKIFEQPNIRHIADVIDQAIIESSVFNHDANNHSDDNEELESFTL